MIGISQDRLNHSKNHQRRLSKPPFKKTYWHQLVKEAFKLVKFDHDYFMDPTVYCEAFINIAVHTTQTF